MIRYCWMDLAGSIILKAVDDYRRAMRKVRRCPGAEKSQAQIRECERFFRSDWFRVLTEVDGEDLIRQLRSEAA
jgi:hypothetical protein